MHEKLVNWFSSLRARLIITYVLLMICSYALLLLLVIGPMKDRMLSRETETLNYLAQTIGSTIRTPWPTGNRVDLDQIKKEYNADQFMTQRRSYEIASEIEARIRMLDTKGFVVTDSSWGYPNSQTKDWPNFLSRRANSSSLSYRNEVLAARYGSLHSELRLDDERPGQGQTLYVARPVMRMSPKLGRQMVAFIIYVDRPIGSVYNDLSILRQSIYYGVLVSLSITILVTIFLSGQLSAGMQSAMRVARGFAAGNMDLRMRERGRDEMGQLGVAFNQMADALQRQEQLRRDLLADVSHELRTPLTAISGCADTLADGTVADDPKTAERFLKIIQRESDRLQRLVTDILELSKLQAGAVVIPVKPIPICPVIEDAVEIAAMHARQEDLTIKAVYPDEIMKENDLLILGNEDRLAQALRNLLDNARHHSPPKGSISVSFEVQLDTVIVHITDEGEGIRPEDQPWVFDRFYRAGKGEKKPGGTGLGLPIVREIMHAHHGKVTVESTIGIGTTFSLHLQRVQTEGGLTS